MIINNESNGLGLLPMGAGYVVRQAAQDHAACGAKVIKGKSVVKIDDAACIQQTQGGTISVGSHNMTILPLLLKEPALDKREEKSYDKLWPSISAFNAEFGLSGRGHLEYFLDKFKKQLDEFVAEFEVVKNQVGAIVLINGEVVGIERAPSYEFWKDMWKPLIRECYGSLSLLAARKDIKHTAKSRVPLKSLRKKTLEGLKEALDATDKAEIDLANEKVRRLVPKEMDVEEGEDESGLKVNTFSGQQFKGQYVDGEDDVVVYLSAFASAKWMKSSERVKRAATAEEFRI